MSIEMLMAAKALKETKKINEKLNSAIYPTTWRQMQEAVKNGLAKEVVEVGDEISNTWIDTAGQKEYDFPLRVNHFEDVEIEGGATVHGMWLESKYTTPLNIQFSQYQAFYVTKKEMPAGTYYVKFGVTWGNAKKDDCWSFTLTKAVPEGGKIAGFRLIAENGQDSTKWKIYTYTADGKTIIEQVGVTSGSDGTFLCTLTNYGDDTSNGLQQTAYGDNRYATSALRQWLNSDKPKGEWWTAQSKYDVAPDLLTQKDGYLRGVDKELIEAMLPVKCTTLCNTVAPDCIKQAKDVTYDKVTLISLEQMYTKNQGVGEEEAHEYYKMLNGTDTPYEWYKAIELLKSYGAESHFAPQYRRLRSAYRGYAYIAWFVNSIGYVGDGSACNAARCQPLVCIGKIN